MVSFPSFTFSQSNCDYADNPYWLDTSNQNLTDCMDDAVKYTLSEPDQTYTFRVAFHNVFSPNTYSIISQTQISEIKNNLNTTFNALNIYFDYCDVEHEVGDNVSTFKQNDYTGYINLYACNGLSVGAGGGNYGDRLSLTLRYGTSGNTGGTVSEANMVSVHEMGHVFELKHTHSTAAGDEHVTRMDIPGCICNCSSEGDFVCDTPANPTSDSFANCEFTPPSFKVDSCGQEYIDTSLVLPKNFMSYYNGECRSSFTAGQILRMKYHIENDPIYQATLVDSPLGVNFNSDTEITSLTTYNTPQFFTKDLNVYNTLVIDATTVKFAAGKGIIIHDEGKVVVDHYSTLTNLKDSDYTCGGSVPNFGKWAGIRFNPSGGTIPVLDLKGGSYIRQAEIGIDAKFDASLGNPSIELLINEANIWECNESISIENASADLDLKTISIHLANASISIKNHIGSVSLYDVWSEQDFTSIHLENIMQTQNSYIGVSGGHLNSVKVINSDCRIFWNIINGENPIQIMDGEDKLAVVHHNTIDSDKTGISIDNYAMADIYMNTIEAVRTGLDLNDVFIFEIYDNIISNPINGNIEKGILLDGDNSNNNFCSNNTILNYREGIVCYGQFGMNNNVSSGLYFTCNFIQGSFQDFYAASHLNPIQSTFDGLEANNQFSNLSNSTFADFQIEIPNYEHKYNYLNNKPDQVVGIEIVEQTIAAINENCTSEPIVIDPGPDAPTHGTPNFFSDDEEEIKFHSIESQISTLLTFMNIDGGTNELYTNIETALQSNNIPYAINEIYANSPNVSNDVFKLIFQYDYLFTEEQMVDLLSQNPTVLGEENVYSFVFNTTSFTPLNQTILKTLLVNDDSVRRENKEELNRLLKERDFTIHRGIAELFASNVYNPVKVDIWLSRLSNYKTLANSRNSKSFLSFKKQDSTFDIAHIFPNPSKNNKAYFVDDISKIKFYASNGNLLMELSNISKLQEIDLSLLGKGLFLYTLTTKDNKIKNGKLLEL